MQQFYCWRLLVMWAWNVFGSIQSIWLFEPPQKWLRSISFTVCEACWLVAVTPRERQWAVKPQFSCSMRRAVGLPQTSVPLSAVCAAQTWTNCTTSPPFLLFPFCTGAYGITFGPESQKWEQIGVFMADGHSSQLFFCSLWLLESKSRWEKKNPAAPWEQLKTLNSPTFHFLELSFKMHHFWCFLKLHSIYFNFFFQFTPPV